MSISKTTTPSIEKPHQTMEEKMNTICDQMGEASPEEMEQMRMEEKVIEKLPKGYKRNGKECYLDPIREKLIYITPEETVRQKVIIHLTENLQVPIEKLLRNST